MAHLRRDEKHYRQLPHRLGTPLIREVLAAFRRNELPATAAAEKLNLGRTRFYELYADYLRAAAKNQQHLWSPGYSGGDHAPDWPQGVESLVRKLLSVRPPADGHAESRNGRMRMCWRTSLVRRTDFRPVPAIIPTCRGFSSGAQF